jgi:hypothetical protein
MSSISSITLGLGYQPVNNLSLSNPALTGLSQTSRFRDLSAQIWDFASARSASILGATRGIVDTTNLAASASRGLSAAKSLLEQARGVVNSAGSGNAASQQSQLQQIVKQIGQALSGNSLIDQALTGSSSMPDSASSGVGEKARSRLLEGLNAIDLAGTDSQGGAATSKADALKTIDALSARFDDLSQSLQKYAAESTRTARENLSKMASGWSGDALNATLAAGAAESLAQSTSLTLAQRGTLSLSLANQGTAALLKLFD